MRHRLVALAVIVLCLAGAGHARADALQAAVDGIMQPAAAEDGVPDLIVGVSQHGQRRYFSYSGTGAPPAPPAGTLVEIGSITKVFTTALYAEAVQAGTMAPNGSIAAYLPGVPLQPCAAQVTPTELADFSSGMPELPPDVPPQLRFRGLDDYTMGNFLSWVSSWSPGNGSGCGLPAPYLYSNASVGLLGIAVANVAAGCHAEACWERLVDQDITGPLGMADTVVRPGPAQRARLLPGFHPDLQPAIPWPVFAWLAAGALRSTAADMLSFGEAALGHASVNGQPVPPALTAALRLAMTPIYLMPNGIHRQAMAWVVGQEGTAWKDGGTDGFNTVIVVDPNRDIAIFVAANRAGTRVPALGLQLARAIP